MKTTSTKNALGRILKWLEGHKRGKAALASLRPPASAAAVAEVERKLKVTLPPAMVAVYRLHDGQDEDAANEKLDGETIESGLFPSIEGRGDLPFLLVPVKHLTRALKSRMPGFRKGWIPFGDNYGGDNMVLDFASAEPKKRGRVLQFNHEYGGAVEVAPSLQKYLEHIADGLASKQVVWDDESGLSYKKGKDWDDLVKRKQVESEEEEKEEPSKTTKAKGTKSAKPPGLAGRWKVVEFHAKGSIFAISGFLGDTIDFTPGGDFIVRPPASERLRRVMKSRYRCDKNHEPPWIDLYDTGPAKWRSRCLGVYRVDGDELLMCTGRFGDPRPDGFDWKKNKRWIGYRMERV